jgi:GTPase
LNEADLEASIATLKSMADTVDAECLELRRRQEKAGTVAEFLIRARVAAKDFNEVR